MVFLSKKQIFDMLEKFEIIEFKDILGRSRKTRSAPVQPAVACRRRQVPPRRSAPPRRTGAPDTAPPGSGCGCPPGPPGAQGGAAAFPCRR